ncbi:MAG: hypothetical protein HKM89_09315 [Gemmatimonadales bacterium]|nr:hypothetical protein [Gemmatimonadales bacterium]
MLLLIGLLALPVAASAQSAEADVMAVITRLFDGMRAGDSAMVRSTFAPDVRLMSAFERDGVPTLTRRTGALDRFVTAVGTPHDEIWDEHIWGTEIRIDDRLATVWTNFAFHLGTNLSHCGVNAFQLFHGTEGWKIINLVDTRRTEGCTSGGE